MQIESRPWATAGRRRSPRHEVTVGDERLSLYWGDLHRHSLISRCTAGDEPSLDDFYRYSFDVCEYDFWAVTDHAENTSPYQWWSIQKLADVLYVKDRFVPFYGFEWTGATGHQNVIYESSRRGAPIYSSTAAGTSNPELLWEHLRRAGQRVLTIPHHPGSAMVPFDWSYAADDMLRLVEVFQACRGNYEHDGCFRQYSDGTLAGTFVQDGLRRGHRFGLISSSDHGNGASYVGAFAAALTREAVFDALQQRRTLAATTRDVVAVLRLNGVFMGGEAPPAGRAALEVTARGYAEIARLDVVSNGTVLHSISGEEPPPAGELALRLRLEWSSGKRPITDWSGELKVRGGRVLETAYWSPEIVDAGKDGIAFSAESRNFNSQYGSQRGGLEVTVIGPPDGVLEVRSGTASRSLPLGEVDAAGTVELFCSEAGCLRLQPGTGGLVGMGTCETSLDLDVEVTEPSWYYARVVLTDGEMAWSSPVWISPLSNQ